ncbi:biotin/lipoyl-binding protein [Stenotrophomonas sp. CD2]|nr:biotin/lipoyl-binding protein [Stenotrophomonas sp. CD2]
MSAVPRKRRRALIIAVALLCSALILFAWLRPAPPPQLQVAPVVRGNIEQVVEATGTLKPSRLVSVGAQVSGRIDTLHVKLGDKVQAGDPIADIDSRTQRNALLSARAAQRTARANRDALATDLRQLELTLHRQRQLVASQLVARADVDAAKAGSMPPGNRSPRWKVRSCSGRPRWISRRPTSSTPVSPPPPTAPCWPWWRARGRP